MITGRIASMIKSSTAATSEATTSITPRWVFNNANNLRFFIFGTLYGLRSADFGLRNLERWFSIRIPHSSFTRKGYTKGGQSVPNLRLDGVDTAGGFSAAAQRPFRSRNRLFSAGITRRLP